MNFGKQAIILAVIDALHRHDSWTGKTHVQKALSLLRDTGRVPLPFEFVLYKHGPYSFDVEGELEQMQSYDGITIDANTRGYGVVLNAGSMAKFVREVAPLSEEVRQEIENACAFVGNRNVAELERLATASWIRAKEGLTDAEAVASRLNSLKPHVSKVEASRADAEVTRWLTQPR